MLRFDRLATLYLVAPLLRTLPSSPNPRIPILMYHSIRDEKETGHPYYRLNTSRTCFAQQMHFLHDSGYEVINLAQARRLLFETPAGQTRNDAGRSSQQPHPAGFVVLTFDDGYEDFYDGAFPILRQFGFTATVFLPTGFIGSDNKRLQRGPHLGWKQVRELRGQGIEFGSHTVNHHQLLKLRREAIADELRISKEVIQEVLGEPVESFSYPFAFPESNTEFKNTLAAMLEGCAYRTGVTTVIGRASAQDHPLFLRRLPVNSSDDLPLFRAKLEGRYDWLHTIQYASKLIQERLRSEGVEKT